MSKEFPQFNEDEPVKPVASAKPKRPSTARAKKLPVANKPKKSVEPREKVAEVIKAPVAEAKVALVEKTMPAPELEWSEAAPESVGGASASPEGGSKRKRRRRKGKGGGASSAASAVEGADVPVPTAQAQPAPPAKVRIDSDALAKAAWKIYLAEVSEEGVALVGDQDARELARRCFRLAEIFLDEQGRRRGGGL